MFRSLFLVLAFTFTLIATSQSFAQGTGSTAPNAPPPEPTLAEILAAIKASSGELTKIKGDTAKIGAVEKSIDGLKKEVQRLENKANLAIDAAGAAKKEAKDATTAAADAKLKVQNLELALKNMPPAQALPKFYTGYVRKNDGTWMSVSEGVPFNLDGGTTHTVWYGYYHGGRLQKTVDAGKCWTSQ